MKIDRKTFLGSLGGADAINQMDSEARADALEHQMLSDLNRAVAETQSGDQSGSKNETKKYPTAAEVEDQIKTRPFRQGAGFLIVPRAGGNVTKLPPMPPNPTLFDFFKLRFTDTSNHVLQSANLAMKNGMSEEIILACMLHDVVQEIIRTDHGWWGAQLFEPYVSERVVFAIRYHQALRYYPDPAVGYEYPDLYRELFGSDYVPPPYIEATVLRPFAAQMVHGRSARHGERLVRLRSECCRHDRSVHRHHRPAFQAAERRAGRRRWPGQSSHTASDRETGPASVERVLQ